MNPATREGITMPHYTPPRSTLLWLQRQMQRDPSLAAVLYATEDPQSIYRFIACLPGVALAKTGAQRRRSRHPAWSGRTSHLWLRSNLPDDELAKRINGRTADVSHTEPSLHSSPERRA